MLFKASFGRLRGDGDHRDGVVPSLSICCFHRFVIWCVRWFSWWHLFIFLGVTTVRGVEGCYRSCSFHCSIVHEDTAVIVPWVWPFGYWTSDWRTLEFWYFFPFLWLWHRFWIFMRIDVHHVYFSWLLDWWVVIFDFGSLSRFIGVLLVVITTSSIFSLCLGGIGFGRLDLRRLVFSAGGRIIRGVGFVFMWGCTWGWVIGFVGWEFFRFFLHWIGFTDLVFCRLSRGGWVGRWCTFSDRCRVVVNRTAFSFWVLLPWYVVGLIII